MDETLHLKKKQQKKTLKKQLYINCEYEYTINAIL